MVVSRPAPRRHVFVDESKQGRYLLVASVHLSTELAVARKALRELTLPGQRRIHMKKESNARRRQIAAALCALGVEATVYEASRSHGHELAAREACLRGLIGDLPLSETLMVLERDDSCLDWDRQTLYQLVRAAERPDLSYQHHRAADEQLLAIPDAIAWCWAKGGDWRRRVEPMVVAVRPV